MSNKSKIGNSKFREWYLWRKRYKRIPRHELEKELYRLQYEINAIKMDMRGNNDGR